eukprot:CAMPEP_0184486546 /NCGR_PEP_ID=MMETSP0113_2-20130426/8033_1 /TAXON_ID=91329 /ORGANISM="Norrisiella sphaerica, Strain BC52" /LENGTH=394 /DNA_ID=CAMNT_0026868473 /DNA_START=181 /DNA_END=1365 /DNA_ORIENTATION=-
MQAANERRIGTKSGGRRYIGRVNRNHLGAASIPSKYETILLNDNKKAKGFISGSVRFKATQEVDTPGPGSYNTLGQRSSESFSKKGFGNFASSSNRFQGSRPTYYPGPGENELSDRFGGGSLKDYRSAFDSRVPRIPRKREEHDVGPGEYYKPASPTRYYTYKPTNALQASAPSRTDLSGGEREYRHSYHSNESNGFMPVVRAGFNVCESRFPKERVAAAPDPGSYNPQLAAFRSNPAASAFKSNQKRTNHNTTNLNPGPGSYDDSHWWRLVKSSGRPSRTFVRNNCDRFGRPMKRLSKSGLKSQQPGPGFYNPAAPKWGNPDNKQLADTWVNKVRVKSRTQTPMHTHVFASRAPRVASAPVPNHPGPAYYKSNGLNNKISYNSKATGKTRVWI